MRCLSQQQALSKHGQAHDLHTLRGEGSGGWVLLHGNDSNIVRCCGVRGVLFPGVVLCTCIVMLYLGLRLAVSNL